MNKRILIVDDDELLCNLLSSYLEEQGFETLVATDATEMQKLRERFHCHLLVLDVVMQGEDGLSICQRLRAEGDKMWAEAILEVYGNIMMEWKNYDSTKNDRECHLETSEVFRP